ncbi:MmgE/PrpD family protein [Spiribacter halobius]|uniref:MmgE/PrpD family protein n=1 Tax=Sediminicurvatus halobius TaxID=2182432 RepID=A0A2U2N9Q8_9GAMM|nr:MmgE/PrpD family protein [Spiribacter halobius]PWG65832.1 MmgE/PrpD family protein [Spiribacter halobius]UEX77876.1 MmgE/PrpD family protein [Spiribacter halobius]
MSTSHAITDQAVAFVEGLAYERLPEEAVHLGLRCILDSVGLYIAGTTEHSVRILIDEARDQGGRADATLLGATDTRVPAAMAARVLGTAGHAHDWDDTQVSHDPAHVYGLLTHPSVPPLTATLVMAQRLGGVDGRRFMTAFLAGFEVECKISEWMKPDHYRRGHHTSGNVGTFGAAVAAASLIGLTGERLRHALGMAASFSAGIRCNFGTMTKPLHVGRAAENGVIAALLAERGFTADPTPLDGRWGYLQVMGNGFSEEKVAEGFANPLTIVSPGVSIKPYPSGILTHQSMDAMLKLVTDHDVKPDEVERITFYAGSNILEPIRYDIAENHLQAKFSMAALLAMMVLYRGAGRREFTDECVGSAAMQDMQRRITTQLDPEIEARGFDRIRSRIELVTRDGRTLTQWADERYRGGPSLPMTDDEVADKFRACTDGLLSAARQQAVIDGVMGLVALDDTAVIGDWLRVQPA